MLASTQNVWLSWTTSDSTALTSGPVYDQSGSAINILQSNVQTTGALTANCWFQWLNEQQLTAEQRQQQAAQEAEWNERRAAMYAAQAAVSERAERLLTGCLSPAQREALKTNGWFEVRAPSGRRYRIRRGRARNIVEVDLSGRHLRTLCCHPYDGVPDADTMLAQKLMLETQEDEFLRLANVS